jgi:hypothetical protein
MDMGIFTRSNAVPFRLAATIVAVISGAVPPPAAIAQRAPNADRVEQLVDYAQCIRENGYPDFPDPAPDGGFKFLIKRGSATLFEAAAAACKDKLPSGLMQDMQDPSPAQMDALLAFAACMRDKGISAFPDPSPQGRFDMRNSNLDLEAPQTRSAMDTCRKAHPVAIRIGG